ncbi:hypothetical protein F8M41_013022 [Gigaspora margarita]|uniref:Uncharacterized protein n=1 Tax=Gigaspora margarita TaxID=4874 RepID=A0A8H4EP81_GIGMA|nr:hypothetical protein F8M41_013022 [Gigaspora margarita]
MQDHITPETAKGITNTVTMGNSGKDLSNKPLFKKKVHNVKESKPSSSNNFQRKTKVQHLEDIEEESEEKYEYYSQGEEEYESEEEKPKIRNVVTTKDFRNKKNYF